MKVTIYRPSAKGIRNGLKGIYRIAYFDYHYVWLNVENGVYSYPTDGDFFEWKPHLKKPDSLWMPTDEIDTKDIIGLDKIHPSTADYSKDEISRFIA